MQNLEEAIIKNDFQSIYDIYHEKKKLNPNDYAIEYLAYVLCALENGANIVMTQDSGKETVLGRVYANDFYGALLISKDFIIIHLLNEIIERIPINTNNNYQGNYSDNFYNHLELIYEAATNKDANTINEVITSYLYSISKDEYVPLFNHLGNFICKYDNYNDLAILLSTFNYPGEHVDVDIVVEWFKNTLESHDLTNAQYLYKILEVLDPQNKDLYNYLLEQINNPKSDEIIKRAQVRREITSEIAFVKATKEISEIPYRDIIDEYIINKELEKHQDIKYLKGEKNFYIAPYREKHNEDLETLHYGSLKSMEIGNYPAAIRKMRTLFECSKDFDEELLTRMLNSYRAINNYDMASTINHLLNDITIEKEEPDIIYTESRSSFNYLIPNIDAIIFEVVKQGKGALETISKYELSEEDEKYTYAIIAREYYKAGYLPIGDKMLKLARKLDNKQDEEYHLLLGEIEKNRKYFQYRTDITFIDELRMVLK